MSLVDLKTLLTAAQEGNYGVGAFSIANMEMVMGAVMAAEENASPIILQIAQSRLPYSPLPIIGPMMVAAASCATVPVAVHFDHGMDLETIGQALALGFTSVMMDASHLPIEQNIEVVKKVREMADFYGASLEAEVGQLGANEDGIEGKRMYYSDPKEVRQLYEQTNADAIALSIGNNHGLYQKEPDLNFQILKDTQQIVPVPLVLHGGTGISPGDFRKCIELGIRKINIATASFLAVEGAARSYSKEEKRDYFRLSACMVNEMKKNVAEHIRIFQSDNRVSVR